ncbi:MAG: CIA30 family protein [Armatimonadetes bacterium]|nr:CIA30 family protein [Armatimonadota bacterium]
MHRFVISLALALTAPAVAAAAGATETDTPDSAPRHWSLVFDFESDQVPEGWHTCASEGALAITREPECVRRGSRALELRYVPETGRLARLDVTGLIMQARPRSLSFSIRTTEPTPLMLGVSEKDGSSYEAYCYSAGNRWYDVSIDLDELMLATGSSDENDILDPREIDAINFADLSNLPGEVGKSLGIKSGEQVMWVDDVRLSTDLAPHRSHPTPDGRVIIYDFEREPPLCLPLGGPVLTTVPGPGDDDMRGLQVEYRTDGYPWVGFVAGVGHLDLSGFEDVCLTLRAHNRARLTLVLEERDGSKYSTRLKLDPAEGWHTVKLPFARFKLDPATKDENSSLDLDQLRVIIPVVDAKRADTNKDELGSYTISRIWCAPPTGR